MAMHEPMITIIVRIDPQLLKNPDADIRYLLPDMLAKRSNGIIQDDGYDYFGEQPFVFLFLKAVEPEAALAVVLETIENDRVLGNDLRRGTVVAMERDGSYDVVYPSEFTGAFMPQK